MRPTVDSPNTRGSKFITHSAAIWKCEQELIVRIWRMSRKYNGTIHVIVPCSESIAIIQESFTNRKFTFEISTLNYTLSKPKIVRIIIESEYDRAETVVEILRLVTNNKVAVRICDHLEIVTDHTQSAIYALAVLIHGKFIPTRISIGWSNHQ